MILKIRNDIINYGNNIIKIKINNIRNKSECVFGYVVEIYDRIFVVNCSDCIKRSFSYSDVLAGIIEIYTNF